MATVAAPTAPPHDPPPARRSLIARVRELSLPLIAGVLAALALANLAPDVYSKIVHAAPLGHLDLVGHAVDFHFLVNEVFMAFFFGIAAKEIVTSTLPGGSLNPFRKALNPLIATAGGVLGPIAVYLAALHVFYGTGAYGGPPGGGAPYSFTALHHGWGIPTATDIALAWLVARLVFGAGHPAIGFLLLLAIADDAIGLVIIAVFYGDPMHPARPIWLLLVLAGMAVAFALRRAGVRKWLPYVAIGGPLAWMGLLLANLHPALALVFVVPFLPGPRPHGIGPAIGEAATGDATAAHHAHDDSPLDAFEHTLKAFVDWGLFFFAFANAGVEFEGIGAMTWTILGALVIGKTVGIGSLALLANKIGLPLPEGMGRREAVMAGFVAALGLTVALFVATAAFVDPHLQGEAKMGALLSGLVGIAAVPLARLVGIRPGKRS